MVQYATVRSGSGAYLQFVEYSTDGINYVAYDTFEINTRTGQQVVMIDLRAVQAANNNPDLKIKIRFGQVVAVWLKQPYRQFYSGSNSPRFVWQSDFGLLSIPN